MQPFLRQAGKPLFPSILWEKPVNKRSAKKLLIIGGNVKHFKLVQQAYGAAIEAGIGEVKIVLPDALQRVIGKQDNCLYVPSTKAGSIDKSATTEILVFAAESDGLLITDDISKNTDTISMLENLLGTVESPTTLTEGVINYLLFSPDILFNNHQRLLIASTQTYVKLANKLSLPVEIQPDQNILNKVQLLKQLDAAKPANYVLSNNQLFVCSHSKASVTNASNVNRENLAAYLTVYWLQHKNAFQALTTAAYRFSKV